MMQSSDSTPNNSDPLTPDAELTPEAWLAKWQTRLRSVKTWDQQFHKLAHDLLTVDSTAQIEADLNLDCAAFEPLLESYVDDLRVGVSTSEFYAPWLAHLAACKHCQAKFEALSEWLAPIWRISSLSRQAQHRSGLVIEFAAAYLVSLFQRPTPLTVRSLDTPTPTQNILADYVTVDQRVWSLSVELNSPQNDPERVTLCADCVTDERLSLRATLHWGQQTYTQPADESGHVCFADLSVAVLQQAHPSVSLEIIILAAPSAVVAH